MLLENIAVDTVRTLEVQRAYQWRIQRVLNTGILVWTPILCAEINEKESCKKDKIIISIVSKHFKSFNFNLLAFSLVRTLKILPGTTTINFLKLIKKQILI